VIVGLSPLGLSSLAHEAVRVSRLTSMSRRLVLQPLCNGAEVCERFDWQLVIVGGVEELA
jgi:hypothetical protein